MFTAILISHPQPSTSFDDHNLSDARSNTYVKWHAINQALAAKPRHLYAPAIQTQVKQHVEPIAGKEFCASWCLRQVQSFAGCYNIDKHAAYGHKLHSEPVTPVVSYKHVSEVWVWTSCREILQFHMQRLKVGRARGGGEENTTKISKRENYQMRELLRCLEKGMHLRKEGK